MRWWQKVTCWKQTLGIGYRTKMKERKEYNGKIYFRARSTPKSRVLEIRSPNNQSSTSYEDSILPESFLPLCKGHYPFKYVHA